MKKNMLQNKRLMLIAGICFDLAGIAALVNYFTSEHQNNTWLTVGLAMIVISLPYYVQSFKSKNK